MKTRFRFLSLSLARGAALAVPLRAQTLFDDITVTGNITVGSTSLTGVATVTQARDVQNASTTKAPSVSSMQAAIAPLHNALTRQGLVFDGTAGATFTGQELPGDFTLVAWATPSALSDNDTII